jgi:hypothetical protein
MPEKTREWMSPQLIVGAVLVVLGGVAMAGEQSAALATTIARLWPAGLIGLGVALYLRRL